MSAPPPCRTPRLRGVQRGASARDGGARGLLGWAALLAAVAAVVVLVQDPGTAATTDAGDQATDDATGEVDLAFGATVYATNCIACHGTLGEGVQGTTRAAGPPIDDADAAYVDQTIRTGRMPLLAPEVGVVPPHDGLPDDQRVALVDWMVAELGIPDSRPPEPIEGDVARGHELYAQHCAQCHGATGAGGVSGDGTLILPVIGVDEVATVEAIRMGPFRMPRFAEGQLDDQEAADVGVFVASLTDQPGTPLGLFEIDRVASAVLVLALFGVVFAVVLLVSHPVDLTRHRRQGPPEGHK